MKSQPEFGDTPQCSQPGGKGLQCQENGSQFQAYAPGRPQSDSRIAAAGQQRQAAGAQQHRCSTITDWEKRGRDFSLNHGSKACSGAPSRVSNLHQEGARNGCKQNRNSHQHSNPHCRNSDYQVATDLSISELRQRGRGRSSQAFRVGRGHGRQTHQHGGQSVQGKVDHQTARVGTYGSGFGGGQHHGRQNEQQYALAKEAPQYSLPQLPPHSRQALKGQEWLDAKHGDRGKDLQGSEVFRRDFGQQSGAAKGDKLRGGLSSRNCQATRGHRAKPASIVHGASRAHTQEAVIHRGRGGKARGTKAGRHGARGSGEGQNTTWRGTGALAYTGTSVDGGSSERSSLPSSDVPCTSDGFTDIEEEIARWDEMTELEEYMEDVQDWLEYGYTNLPDWPQKDPHYNPFADPSSTTYKHFGPCAFGLDTSVLRVDEAQPPLVEAAQVGDLDQVKRILDDVKHTGQGPPAPRAPAGQRCAVNGCMASGGKLLKCGGCDQVHYCGRDHQLQHWPQHKIACKSGAAAEARKRDVLNHARRWTELQFDEEQEVLQKREWFDLTPLAAAAQNGHHRVVHYLLCEGADPTLIGVPGQEGDKRLDPLAAARDEQVLREEVISAMKRAPTLPRSYAKRISWFFHPSEQAEEAAEQLLDILVGYIRTIALLHVAAAFWGKSPYRGAEHGEERGKLGYPNQPSSIECLRKALCPIMGPQPPHDPEEIAALVPAIRCLQGVNRELRKKLKVGDNGN